MTIVPASLLNPDSQPEHISRSLSSLASNFICHLCCSCDEKAHNPQLCLGKGRRRNGSLLVSLRIRETNPSLALAPKTGGGGDTCGREGARVTDACGRAFKPSSRLSAAVGSTVTTANLAEDSEQPPTATSPHPLLPQHVLERVETRTRNADADLSVDPTPLPLANL
ncbi:unnamed protein product [Schistocephalus solidus]|uniref:Uncharacterized protein n=1 Tax=Schistocephalus solidus TaxID=70667 RepID=A0A183SIZ0_SCHSO|nr:unnamed protein product [Schistocephalus solidus]